VHTASPVYRCSTQLVNCTYDQTRCTTDQFISYAAFDELHSICSIMQRIATGLGLRLGLGLELGLALELGWSVIGTSSLLLLLSRRLQLPSKLSWADQCLSHGITHRCE